MEYVTSSLNAWFEWLRLPGDAVFISGGVLPLLYLCWLGVRHQVSVTSLEEPEHMLFAELSDPSQR